MALVMNNCLTISKIQDTALFFMLPLLIVHNYLSQKSSQTLLISSKVSMRLCLLKNGECKTQTKCFANLINLDLMSGSVFVKSLLFDGRFCFDT